jgi:hypothetical protein
MVATGEVFDTALDPIDDALVQKIRTALAQKKAER